jgi:hypothetical protein
VCREATPAPDNLFFLFAVCDRQVARVWPQATSANKSSLSLPRAPKAPACDEVASAKQSLF